MSITDELRKYVQDWRETPNLMDDLDAGDVYGILADFEHIADRIDATYDGAMNRAGQLLDDAEHDRNCYHVNWMDCKYKVLQGNITIDELNARIECLEDELSHRIELPKDANDVPIHVGDMMERGKARGHVIALMLSEYPKKWGGELHWAVQLEGEQAPTALDGLFLHCHEPTVEDVLSEMLEQAFPSDFMHRSEAIEAMVAEYAAKLRLADGED